MLTEVQKRVKIPYTAKADIQMLQTLNQAESQICTAAFLWLGAISRAQLRRDVSGKSLISWWPDCSCAMALRDEIWTEKDLHWLPLGQQHAHLGFPNHPCSLWRIWTNLGKPCALEGSSVPICVHWKSRENYFRKYTATLQALRAVAACISEIFCRCPNSLCKAIKSQQYQTRVKAFRHLQLK